MNPIIIPILGISCGLLAIIGGVFIKPWFAYRHRKMELEAAMVAEKAAQYAAGSARLEERVRVLERIVTDRGMDLSDEIERLRDPSTGSGQALSTGSGQTRSTGSGQVSALRDARPLN